MLTNRASDSADDRSLSAVECSIPPEMTVEQWRALRSSGRRPKRRRLTRPAPAKRRVVPLRPDSCDHLHESTTRYDYHRKLLTFLLVCPVCGTERVVSTQHYEPRFVPGTTTSDRPAA